MKQSKPEDGPKPDASRRRFASAIALSAALHAPLAIPVETKEVWEERGNIAYVAKESVKSTVGAHPLEKLDYIDTLKEALEKENSIDLGTFYLKSQYLDGRLEEEEMKKALAELDKVEAELRARQGTLKTLEVLAEITKKQGEYSRPHSYLSTVALEGRGNCHAREKFTATLIHRLYPEMEIAYQTVKVQGVMHTRTLVKIRGKWHNMEEPKGEPFTEADFDETVVYRKYDYVRDYIGEDNLGEFRGNPATTKKTRTKFSVTDDYLRMPLPDGVDTDMIRDVAEGSRGGSGVAGSVGSPAQPGENGQTGAFSPYQNKVFVNVFYDPDFAIESAKVTRKLLGKVHELSDANPGQSEAYLRTWLPSMPESCFSQFHSIIRFAANEVSKGCDMDNFGTLKCDRLDKEAFAASFEKMAEQLDKDTVCGRYADTHDEAEAFFEHLEKEYKLDL